MLYSEETSTFNQDKGTRAQDTANGVISVTERYAKPEFGSGSSNEEDEDLHENQALEHDQDDEDDELLDPYTEDEEKCTIRRIPLAPAVQIR
jgi:hypothetical protein